MVKRKLTFWGSEHFSISGAPPNTVNILREKIAPEIFGAITSKTFIAQQNFITWNHSRSFAIRFNNFHFNSEMFVHFLCVFHTVTRKDQNELNEIRVKFAPSVFEY